MHTHIEKRIPRTRARNVEAAYMSQATRAAIARRLARRVRQQTRMRIYVAA
jgi:hypothetical protein